MTATEIEALFAETLAGDYESEAAWAAVSKLRLDGDRETFERAKAWVASGEPLKRARAVDILCQLMRAQTPTGTTSFQNRNGCSGRNPRR